MINYLKVELKGIVDLPVIPLSIVCLFLSLCLDKIVEANEPNDRTYLVAWQSGEYIQLRWNTDSDGQFVGYNIYRSLTTDGEWEKLNSSPLSIDSFVDYSPLQSEIVYYKVTRLDVEQNESLTATVEVKWKRHKKIEEEWNQGASAVPFDKNNIISNRQFTNYSSMTLKQIQDFLSSQGSVLKDFSFDGKSAAQHIYDACQAHKINPQVVLVTLQKEMGLITSSTLSSGHNNDLRAKTDAEKWRLSLAMGWDPNNRFDNHNFGSQIYLGTKQFRRYYENLGKYGWSIGQPHKINDGVVNPVDVSTAGLYIYTPYIGEKNGFRGNYMFWYLWYNIFGFNGQAGIPEQTKERMLLKRNPLNKSLPAPTLTEKNDSSVSAQQGQKSAPLDGQREVEQFSSALDNNQKIPQFTLERSESSTRPTVSVKSSFSKTLLGDNSMLVIIIILSILAVGTIIGIKFLRIMTRQDDKNNATTETTLKTDEIYDVVELLAQIIHQLEETEEDEKLKKFKEDILAQVNKTDIETPVGLQPIKEDLKKAIHQIDDATESKDETIPQQKLGEDAKSNARLCLSEYDDISTLVETLAILAGEYQETYQKLRQIIASRYKQLQEASQYIDEQTEKLNQLMRENKDVFTDEIQASKNPLKYAEVHELAEQGIDRTEIAQRTKLPVGEVDLLLSLSNHTASA